MTDFNKSIVRTEYGVYEPITKDDAQLIIDIRRSAENSVLREISLSLSAQQSYFDRYKRRFDQNKEVYFKILQKGDDRCLGLVRLTELDKDRRFNYQSLVLRKDSPPFLAIDAIFTMYELGFVEKSKDICGPWMVPRSGTQVRKLHLKMGIATEVMANEDFHFFIVTKDMFIQRREFFKNLGFGLQK